MILLLLHFQFINLKTVLSAILLILFLSDCSQKSFYDQVRTVTLEPDTLSVLRNPAMGWVMYSEGWELYPYFQENFDRINVDSFWKEMDALGAHKISNILYIRAVWSAFEPEEGKYVWEHDQEFIKLIEGAKQRNLKLAFRVFHHSGDQEQQATPEYVFEAGAKHTWIKAGPKYDQNFKNPYYDDPVFMEKFDAFVQALAAEFDDPQTTDFIDAYGAGLWGEGHGVDVQDEANMASVIDGITGIYAKHFHRILPVYNLSYVDWKYSKPIVYEKRQFLPRRDGLGSHWFPQVSKNRVNNYFFPKYPLIGEGCYWLNDPTGEKQTNWYEKDKKYTFTSWPDAIAYGVEDAINHHSNTFDLRVPLQAKMWIEKLPDVVQGFITNGGYRLYPKEIKVEFVNENTLTIDHTWTNLAVGLLPNHHPNWNYKYKVAFGFRNKKTREVIGVQFSESADPGKWIKGHDFDYSMTLQVPEIVDIKDMELVTAIINTEHGNPEIELALKESPEDKWYRLVEF